MTHSALVGMTSDPSTGVVAVVRSVHFVMEKEELSYTKEAVIRKLNLNMNTFYPDAGGILMGYLNVKIKKNTSKVTPTPVNIQAMQCSSCSGRRLEKTCPVLLYRERKEE
jgi:hypothetical protein